METQIQTISDNSINTALEILQNGGVVAFPTETVYGLGANAFDASAVGKIFTAKGRPADNPLSILVADRAMMDLVAVEVPEIAERLIEAFSPGPLTLILKRRQEIPYIVAGGLPTIGVRIPQHEGTLDLIRQSGMPLAAPSANTSGRPSPTSAQAVYDDLQGKIPLILDGGSCSLGVESTIVDCTQEKLKIIRPGFITLDQLEAIAGVGQVELVGVMSSIAEDVTMEEIENLEEQVSSQEKYLHYAPKAPMTLLEGKQEHMVEAMSDELNRLKLAGKLVGVVASDEVIEALVNKGDILSCSCISYGKQGDLMGIAAKLYDALRGFDEKMVTAILAEGVSDEGLGAAVMNRLRKASNGNSIYFS